ALVGGAPSAPPPLLRYSGGSALATHAECVVVPYRLGSVPWLRSDQLASDPGLGPLPRAALAEPSPLGAGHSGRDTVLADRRLGRIGGGLRRQHGVAVPRRFRRQLAVPYLWPTALCHFG